MNALGAAGLILLWLASPVAGQAQKAQPAATKTSAAKKGSVPRTPWGAPDLMGVWDFRTLTPLERPKTQAGKQVFSAEEAAEFEQAQLADQAARDSRPPADVVGNYNQFWFDPGNKVQGTKRTSLIVDPPDGRIPPLTPEAQKREARIAETRKGLRMHDLTPGGWVEDFGPDGLQVRCIVGFNSGPPMTPGAYNQNVQLFQTKDHVVILNEMIHNARIVPLDGRPHGKIRQWVGESRGRWEGDTLVVDTRNFLRETSFQRGRSTANLHLIERFTRVDNDTLLYEFTVNDPTVWTKPWTAQISMALNSEPMYEYACHEGNYGMYNMLAGARADEEKAARKGSK
jgi:hypothetical protein